jgi:hypothetical protein
MQYLYKEKSCYDEVIGLFEWPKTDYNQKCIPNQHRKEKKPLPTLPNYKDKSNGQLTWISVLFWVLFLHFYVNVNKY